MLLHTFAYAAENQNLSKDFKMDLTELNAVRLVTGSRPKIDPRVLIAQNINEWVYNHVVIHVEQLLINMPAKEGDCTPPNSANPATQSQSSQPAQSEISNTFRPQQPRPWGASQLKSAFQQALTTAVAEDAKGLNKTILDELFTTHTGRFGEWLLKSLFCVCV
jgi:hypothetical protein